MIRKILEFYFKCYYRLALNLCEVNEAYYIEKFSRPLPKGFVFKMLSIADIHYFESLGIKESYRQILLNRFNNPQSHQCYAVIDENNDVLAYYCWTNSSKKYYHNEFERVYSHSGDTILFENDFASPDYRKLGLHSYCLLQRILFAKRNGFKKAIINIHFKNFPALKTAYKFGFKKTLTFPVSYRKGTITYTINKLTRR